MARRGYPPEFRRRVIDLVEGGRKVAEVAVELEVSEQTIYTWRRQARINVVSSRTSKKDCDHGE
jgi:transposase-like protein